jgi:hypothetical protein
MHCFALLCFALLCFAQGDMNIKDPKYLVCAATPVSILVKRKKTMN